MREDQQPQAVRDYHAFQVFPPFWQTLTAQSRLVFGSQGAFPPLQAFQLTVLTCQSPTLDDPFSLRVVACAFPADSWETMHLQQLWFQEYLAHHVLMSTMFLPAPQKQFLQLPDGQLPPHESASARESSNRATMVLIMYLIIASYATYRMQDIIQTQRKHMPAFFDPLLTAPLHLITVFTRFFRTNEESVFRVFCILITMIKLVLWLIILACVCAHKTNQELKVTLVTGLWNVNRGDLLIFKRSFDYYLNYLRDTMLVKDNIIFFGDAELQKFVESNRQYQGNIHFIQKDLNDISKYWYTDKIGQVIDKTKESWLKWQRYSILPQYGLRMYNPVVMSKLRFLAEASLDDPFDSDYYVWIDGAMTHNMPPSVLSQGRFIDFSRNYQLDFFIQTGVSLPFHPFEVGFKNDGREYADLSTRSRYFVWGNWLGGKATAVTTAYHIYQNFLRITLENMEMNTDEAIFFLMLERYDYLINRIVDPDPQTLLRSIKINSSVVDERYSLRVINATDVIAYSELWAQNTRPCIDAAPLNLYYDMKGNKYVDIAKDTFVFTLKIRVGLLVILLVFGLVFKLNKKERTNAFQQLTSQEME